MKIGKIFATLVVSTLCLLANATTYWFDGTTCYDAETGGNTVAFKTLTPSSADSYRNITGKSVGAWDFGATHTGTQSYGSVYYDNTNATSTWNWQWTNTDVSFESVYVNTPTSYYLNFRVNNGAGSVKISMGTVTVAAGRFSVGAAGAGVEQATIRTSANISHQFDIYLGSTTKGYTGTFTSTNAKITMNNGSRVQILDMPATAQSIANFGTVELNGTANLVVGTSSANVGQYSFANYIVKGGQGNSATNLYTAQANGGSITNFLFDATDGAGQVTIQGNQAKSVNITTMTVKGPNKSTLVSNATNYQNFKISLLSITDKDSTLAVDLKNVNANFSVGAMSFVLGDTGTETSFITTSALTTFSKLDSIIDVDFSGGKIGESYALITSNTVLNLEDFYVDENYGELSLSDGGKTLNLTVLNIPEPAEVAILFGLIALGFVSYRRKYSK